MILKIKYDLVIENKGFEPPETIVQYCKDLLPIIEDLDSPLSLLKGKVALKLAQTQLEIYKRKMQEKLISKEDFFKEIKPYIMLQIEAKKLIF